jgi:phage pi2 protein 07
MSKKVKVLIELDEGEYEHLKNGCFDYWSAEAVHNAIANGTVITDDAISRESMKDEVRKHAEYYADRTEEDRYNVGYTECACEVLDFVDNAPVFGEEDYGTEID